MLVLDNSKNTPYIIKNLSLEIPKGQKIGIIGGTGSGKSTLVDLMMGLLKPTSGNISIDGMELKGNSSKMLNAWRLSSKCSSKYISFRQIFSRKYSLWYTMMK